MEIIDELVDHLYKIVEYLHDWVSSREGKYRPISIQSVRDTYLMLVAQNNGDFVKAMQQYKDDVESGKILLFDDPALCTPKIKALYGEVYKRHIAKVKEFEKKYIIYEGHNNSNN